MNLINILRDQSPWFSEYREFLSRNQVKLPHEVTSGYLYPHLNLYTCMLPRKVRRIRGRSMVFVGLDEPAWFDFVGVERDSLDDVLRACNISCQTTRNIVLQDKTRFGGYVVAASAPCQRHDTFDRMLKKSGDRYYSSRIPVWNMNPTYTRDMFNSEFQRSRWAADRDFGVRVTHDSEISEPDTP